MSSNLSLIKALATTLLSELDSIQTTDDIVVDDENFDLNEKLREFEIKLIKLALTVTGGNQSRAAQLLKIKCSTLNNKIKTYPIEYPKTKALKPATMYRVPNHMH